MIKWVIGVPAVAAFLLLFAGYMKAWIQGRRRRRCCDCAPGYVHDGHH